ncbi:hypothetical protein RND81_02G067000 [Saponaria officinalis]|uniref:RING-type E3 ubiquitin transferase n=1 Tax=Saponaria officinalis TaxID=3572 RepID=A0AAW1ML29_SAPOF
MASHTPSSSPPPPPPPPPPSSHSPPQPPPQYWCHHCDKRVSVESVPGQPDLICFDCKFGFVESIPSSSSLSFSAAATNENNAFVDETTLGSQFIHVLRLLAQVARDDHPSPPSPPPLRADADDRDFLRIQIDGGDNEDGDEVDDNDDDEEEESVRSVEIEGDSDNDDDDVDETDEELRRRQRRDLLRQRLRDFATLSQNGGRNRILDWAEILMGLENNSVELRFETDRYIGNPGDYVNEAEYEALLQNLAEAEGRRGAPPASKSAVEGLKTVVVKEEEGCLVCAICKDGVSVGEVVKEMPCGHGYHGECIATWLDARNSCPVCRFELPTDDAEYEEDKRKNTRGNNANAAAGGSSASSF